MRILFLFLFLSAGALRCNGQILISILLGDKINSGKLEFGLDGGLSVSSLHGLDPSKTKSSLNLGFYFDFKLKNSWYFNTGVMVKSTMGATKVNVYSLNNPELDNSFKDGSVTRRLGYFNVPFMMKYKFKNQFFVEAGPMISLMNKSTDEFIATVADKDDLTYKVKIRDWYHPLDAGVIGGVGYRLQGGNGMNIAVRYYYGFVDITVDDLSPGQYNRSLYFAVGIPIGVSKKKDNTK